MNKKLMMVAAICVMLLFTACKNEAAGNAAEETAKQTTAVETEMVTEPTETLPDIEREDGVRETEPEVNKAIIVTAPATEPTEAADGTKPTEEDASDETSVTIPAEEVGTPVEETTAYENLMAMSGEDQKAFMESFGSMDKFFAWLEAAKAEHDAIKAPIEIGSDGVVNIG